MPVRRVGCGARVELDHAGAHRRQLMGGTVVVHVGRGAGGVTFGREALGGDDTIRQRGSGGRWNDVGDSFGHGYFSSCGAAIERIRPSATALSTCSSPGSPARWIIFSSVSMLETSSSCSRANHS